MNRVILSLVGVLVLIGAGCSTTQINQSLYTRAATIDIDCNELKPKNFYSSGTGHYAGWDWAERANPGLCTGNSSSFIEGCENYQKQLGSYLSCTNEE